MTEDEYILVTNKTAIKSAIESLMDVMEGHKYGVDKKLYKKVRENLSTIQQNLFSCIELEVKE